MIESAELLRHRLLQARSQHPQGDEIPFELVEIEQSLPVRFNRIASAHPDRISVCGKETALTYRELDEASSRVAQAIVHERGTATEPVGILAEHGVPAIVATLAVLKAGKFYVPLDPTYPCDRLAYMLDDTDASLIVTDQNYLSNAVGLARNRISIVTMDERDAGRCAVAPDVQIEPDSLAAVYYTSGSTGRPKGIMYTHRYVLHNMMTYGNAFHVSPHDRWSWLHSYSFSPALTDILCPLLHGAASCPWDVKRDGLTGLERWLNDAGVTILHWMATPLRSFAASLDRRGRFSSMRMLICGGEKLLAKDVASFREFFPPECVFVNRYGASEAGLCNLFFIDGRASLQESVVPAGFAVPDKTAVIVDEHESELGAGLVGEIGVRSRFLPLGYWRQPEKTNEKYRSGVNGHGTRMYLTGDLGRMRPDGCLEFCGRKDNQVKVRGHRVEIEEIENAILQIEGVDEVAVKAIERVSGDWLLTGYYVARPGASIDESEVRRHLLEKLPDYMIPAAILRLDALPRNSNHKIDRAALPTPQLAAAFPSERYAPPQTPLQCHLVELWQTILDIQPIGIDDDFFALGGDSLTGIQVVSKVQSLVNSILHVPPLFEHPTVRTFSEFLESTYGSELRRHMPHYDAPATKADIPTSERSSREF